MRSMLCLQDNPHFTFKVSVILRFEILALPKRQASLYLQGEGSRSTINLQVKPHFTFKGV